MLRLPLLLLLTCLLVPFALSSPSASFETRQGTGCFCGVITGLSCGSRTSTGLSLSGDCSPGTLYSCAVSFDNAVVSKRCLICDTSAQDGYDSCLLGLGL
ncbi:hypothetical protein BKA61DRAFT_617599 [Leptodontidium sp. MPI-SDFR-AT-0119]|nr:hypothetical protein BKA61DRAFT_617599 [Leptodontidium sp. MPI-SDFR-AT-0119]